MTYARFFRLLAVVTGIAVAGAALCHLLLPIGYALPFTLLTAVLFAGICVALFYFGEKTAGAENKMLFGNVFMGATMAKMLLCGMLVVLYVILGEPASKLFIVPFFWLYLVYTGYEIFFLMKLSRITGGREGE